MQWNKVLSAVGAALLFLTVAMIVPLIVGIAYREEKMFFPWLLSIGFTGGMGFFLFWFFKTPQKTALTQREGIAIVAFTWLGISLAGSLPFIFSSSLPITEAVFESVSGFTTTGFTSFSNVQAEPHAILFWRSFMQWLGGMGIIVISIAIFPFLGVGGGMQLFKTELSNPTGDKIRPRIQDTARTLWKVYLLLTATEIILLMIGGMNLFDSVCHSFSTVATGGFSTKNNSIAYFNSAYIENVIMIFMLLSGISFTLFYYMIAKKEYWILWKNPETKFYIIVVCILSILIFIPLLFAHTFQNAWVSLRHSFFHLISLVTTTGFTVTDYTTWPVLPQIILFLSMFMGACAGSTTGGIKMYRIMLYAKFCYSQMFQLIHSRVVHQVKIKEKVVPPQLIRNALGFLGLYLFVCAVGVLLLAAMNVDGMTAAAAVISCVGNGGSAFGGVGPSETLTGIPMAGKWVLSICMLVGRLEIYTFLLLLVPAFWRK